MRLFLLPPSFNGSDNLKLTGKDCNYITKVLRLKKGQCFSGRDKNGETWNLTIISSDENSCLLSCSKTDSIQETTDALPQDRPQKNIILYQCLPKGRKADDIIKKATEIGVRTIVLVKSRNCVADLSGKENSRISRYESVVKEAVQQSGSLVPTTVEGVIDIRDVADDFSARCKQLEENGLGIILHQAKLSQDQNNLFDTVKDFSGCVGILVGSEGGFTDEECNLLLSRGFKAVLLKTNILRCETAAIYAISAVQTLIER